MSNGGQPVLEGVGGANGRVEGLAGVQVVIDPVDARRSQLPGLILIQESERATDLDRELALNGPYRIRDLGDLAVQRAAPADADTIAVGSGRSGSPCDVHHLLHAEPPAPVGGGGR